MEMELIATMLVSVVLILAVAGTIILRPLSKHLATLLEAMARERASANPKLGEQLAQIRELMQTQSERMGLVEERLEFTESLVRRQGRNELAPGEQGRAQAGSPAQDAPPASPMPE